MHITLQRECGSIATGYSNAFPMAFLSLTETSKTCGRRFLWESVQGGVHSFVLANVKSEMPNGNQSREVLQAFDSGKSGAHGGTAFGSQQHRDGIPSCEPRHGKERAEDGALGNYSLPRAHGKEEPANTTQRERPGKQEIKTN